MFLVIQLLQKEIDMKCVDIEVRGKKEGSIVYSISDLIQANRKFDNFSDSPGPHRMVSEGSKSSLKT